MLHFVWKDKHISEIALRFNFNALAYCKTCAAYLAIPKITVLHCTALFANYYCLVTT